MNVTTFPIFLPNPAYSREQSRECKLLSLGDRRSPLKGLDNSRDKEQEQNIEHLGLLDNTERSHIRIGLLQRH